MGGFAEIFRPAAMSGSAKSIYYFGMYLVVIGLLILFFPKLPLTILNLDTGSEQSLAWIRILGMLVLIYAYYYIRLSRAEVNLFFRLTVHTRALVPVVFALLIFAGALKPILILFALGDFLGALWTFLMLQRTRGHP